MVHETFFGRSERSKYALKQVLTPASKRIIRLVKLKLPNLVNVHKKPFLDIRNAQDRC